MLLLQQPYWMPTFQWDQKSRLMTTTIYYFEIRLNYMDCVKQYYWLNFKSNVIILHYWMKKNSILIIFPSLANKESFETERSSSTFCMVTKWDFIGLYTEATFVLVAVNPIEFIKPMPVAKRKTYVVPLRQSFLTLATLIFYWYSISESENLCFGDLSSSYRMFSSIQSICTLDTTTQSCFWLSTIDCQSLKKNGSQ